MKKTAYKNWKMNSVCLWSDNGMIIPNCGIEFGNYLINYS